MGRSRNLDIMITVDWNHFLQADGGGGKGGRVVGEVCNLRMTPDSSVFMPVE